MSVPSRYSAEPGFSAAAPFGISASVSFPFGLHQGTRIGHRLFGLDDPQLHSVKANIHDERSVDDALAGAYGVVNAVSLYVEHGQETFRSVHVESAQRVAAQARRAGVERLAHVSGIGSDAASPSLCIRKRWEGELAVRAAFADAILIRPAVMFGPDDSFLTTILKLLGRLPVYPMFGRGLNRGAPQQQLRDAATIVHRRPQLRKFDGLDSRLDDPQHIASFRHISLKR